MNAFREYGSDPSIMEILDSVETTGEPGTVFISPELGNIEVLLHEIVKKGFRIAPVPAGCITFFPRVEIGDDELFHFCKEYCLTSQASRAEMRRNLYLKVFPDGSDCHSCLNGLYTYNYQVRIAELCLLVSNSSPKVAEYLYATSPYLQISSVKGICSAISSLISANGMLDNSINNDDEFVVLAPKKTRSNSLSKPTVEAVEKKKNRITAVLTGSEEVDENIATQYFSEKDFDLVTESGVFNDHDKVAAVYVKNGIDASICEKAAGCLEKAATTNNLRSRTNGGVPPETGIVGYYDYLLNPTQKKCRETQFMRKHWGQIKNGCTEFLDSLNTLYSKAAPAHFQLQKKIIPQSYQLFGTVFSTITVNRNFRTAPHTDKGDFKSGLAALCVVKGKFRGCHLAIPKIGKAFELKVGDALFFDASLLHGNTEVSPLNSSWQRISVVCYLRNGLMSGICEAERRKHLNMALAEKLEDPTTRFKVINVNDGEEGLPSIFIPTQVAMKLASAQLSAIRFAADRISNRNGCIISMAMGLGKTLVALTLAFSSLYTNPAEDVLVIAPKSCIVNWLREIAKWAPSGLVFDNTISADGSSSSGYENKIFKWNNQSCCSLPKKGYLIILNPEIVQSFCARSAGFQPAIIIVDEGHCLSSKGNKLTSVLNQFQYASRVVLTGTPLQNEAAELYRLVQWVYDGVSTVLPKRAFLDLEYTINEYINGNDSAFRKACVAQQYIIDWMKAFVFREVDRDLPLLHDYLLVCGNSDTQNKTLKSEDGFSKGAFRVDEHRLCYLAAHPFLYSDANHFCFSGKRNRDEAGTEIAGREGTLFEKNDIRKKCKKESRRSMSNSSNLSNHLDRDMPMSSHSIEEGENTSFSASYLLTPLHFPLNGKSDVKEFASHSGKLSVLLCIAKHISMRKEKAIIFSQYIYPQGLISETLAKAGYTSFWMRGRDSAEDRQSTVDNFLKSRKPCFLVLSSKIAAFGHDFTEANHVVLFDLWWNPQVELQAIARSYRRNQTKPVIVYRLASKAEDRHILKIQLRKLALFRCIMDGSVSRSRKEEEFIDMTDIEDDEERKALWLELKNSTKLSGGFDALDAVYRYSDTVKEGVDVNYPKDESI